MPAQTREVSIDIRTVIHGINENQEIRKRSAAELLSISEILSNIRNENLERNLREFLETHKKMQSVFEAKTLPTWAKFLHKSIKICEIYSSRMQFKSKPFHLPLSAVTLQWSLHCSRMISAAANKTELYILYVQIKPINSKEMKSNPFELQKMKPSFAH